MTRHAAPPAGAPSSFAWTPKRAAFCQEYLVDLNLSAAARRAGFSTRTAKQQGAVLYQMPEIRARIDALMQARADATRIQAYKVLEELAIVAFSSLDHYRIDDDGHVTVAPDAPDGAIRAVSKLKRTTKTNQAGVVTIETEIHLWDKGTATSNALKHLGLLTEKHEITGKDGGPLDVDVSMVRERIAHRLERIMPRAEPAL